ncbi:hypothetical protein GCM10027436_07470 [Actinophytocola sediminis]
MAAASDLDAGIRAYLRRAPDAVVRCRLLGHAWDPTHDGFIADGQGKDQVYTQTVRCMRCDSTGVDRFDPMTLERINTRSYDYVDGYLARDRQGGISRREVRQWMASKAKATSGRRLRKAS